MTDQKLLTGIEKVVQTAVFDSYTFGLQWNNSPISPNGQFPQYYKESSEGRVAVAAAEVPKELLEKHHIYTRLFLIGRLLFLILFG